MKTSTVVIGLVIIVIGVALFIGGAVGALGSITINRTFTQPTSGEYVSAEVVLNASSGLAITSPAAVGGLIHAQDLSLVTSSNIGTYAVPYNSTAAGSEVYSSLVGDYYYVAFSSTQPSTTSVAPPQMGAVRGVGSLVLLGIVLVIAGIVVAIIGVFQKKKQPVQNQG